jgi:hypothetical protein
MNRSLCTVQVSIVRVGLALILAILVIHPTSADVITTFDLSGVTLSSADNCCGGEGFGSSIPNSGPGTATGSFTVDFTTDTLTSANIVTSPDAASGMGSSYQAIAVPLVDSSQILLHSSGNFGRLGLAFTPPFPRDPHRMSLRLSLGASFSQQCGSGLVPLFRSCCHHRLSRTRRE